MATSGTVAQTTITVIDLLTSAIQRCGKKANEITPEILELARRSLFFYITSLGNLGINLWTIDYQILGLIKNQGSYVLPAGTIDVLNVLYRTTTRVSAGAVSSAGGTVANAFDGNISTSCTQLSANGNISIDFTTSGTVITVGIMPNGNQTYNLVYETSDDFVTWTTVYAPGSVTYVDKSWTYADIAVPITARYFRVRETAGGTLNIRELIFGTNVTEIPLGRINNDDYTNLPNKQATSSQPCQFWYNRLLTAPKLVLWQVPNTYFGAVVAWRHRQIQDIGAFTNEVEMPQRWSESLITNLSARISLEIPGVEPWRIEMLAKLAAGADIISGNEERDNSPMNINVNIGAYTR